MPVVIGGSGPVTGVTSINTTVSDTELGYLDGVTSAIQTQINGAGGLVKITDSTFSAQSTVSVNNCFSSTYENYRITLVGNNTNNNDINFRLRASGSDNTTSNYFIARNMVSQTGTASASSVNAGTFMLLSTNTTGAPLVSLSFDVLRPNISTAPKHIHGGGFMSVSDSYGHQVFTGTFNDNAAFDGFSLITSGGNMSGTLRIYGYRD